jgi:hypothetical protein
MIQITVQSFLARSDAGLRLLDRLDILGLFERLDHLLMPFDRSYSTLPSRRAGRISVPT